MTGLRVLTTYDELEDLLVSAESYGTLRVVLDHAINPWILAGTEDGIGFARTVAFGPDDAETVDWPTLLNDNPHGLRIAWDGTPDHDHTPPRRPQDV